MAQKYVGIDLGSHHIKGVVVSAGFRGMQVLDAFEEPVGSVPPPAEGAPPVNRLGHQLSVALHALRARGLLSQPIGISLPPGLLSYRLLSFPFADERRIAQTVGFEADGQFPVPIEDLVHGHVVVPAPEGGGRALVVAAARDKVEQIDTLFERAGADVKVVTSPAIAMAQVAKIELPAEVPAQGEQSLRPVALMVDIGHRHTHFVAVGPKGPQAVRTLRRGGKNVTDAIARHYRLGQPEAEAAKHRDAFLPHHGFSEISDEQMAAGKVVAEAFEPILRELEHTRLWLRATYQLESVKLILVGGGSHLGGLDSYLGEHTGLPIERFYPGASGLKLEPEPRWSSLAPALGAAYGAARRPLVQLQVAEGAQGDASWLQERMSSLIAIGVAVLAFGALDTIARVRAAEAELAAYEDELAEASQSVFGEALDPADVDVRLAEADGADLTSLIPQRGALEVLAMITKAATPTDLAETAQAGVPTPGVPVPGAAGAEMAPGAAGGDDEDEDGGDDEDEDGGDGTGATSAPVGPVPQDAGIVVSDNLVIDTVKIRERKIELKAIANSASAQDRLAIKLQELGCISNISKGKIRGDERKSFEMTMDSRCFRAAEQTDDEDEDEESEG